MPLPGSGRATTEGGPSSISGGSNLSEVSLEAELEYWKEIKDSTEAADFEIFVQVFPESRFAPLARRRMNRLEADAQSSRDADERGQQETAQRAGIEAEQAVRGADGRRGSAAPMGSASPGRLKRVHASGRGAAPARGRRNATARRGRHPACGEEHPQRPRNRRATKPRRVNARRRGHSSNATSTGACGASMPKSRSSCCGREARRTT